MSAKSRETKCQKVEWELARGRAQLVSRRDHGCEEKQCVAVLLCGTRS